MFISDRPALTAWQRCLQRMRADIRAAQRKDPASSNTRMALLHQGVHAVLLHRVAHRVNRSGFVVAARLLSYLTRVLTGVDLHPGAVVEPGVFIDHGCGVVIGETAVLESDVMLYHNVTVGSVGWWNPKIRDERRHPIICRGAVLCTGALVLGPITVGPGCVVGANAIVLADVPADTRIPPGHLWQADGSKPIPRPEFSGNGDRKL